MRKTYHYHLDTRLALDPFTRRHALHVGWRPPDLDRLRAAAAVLVGTHDFSAFANNSRDGGAARDPVRTIYRFDVVDTGGLVRLEVEGNGFLYKGVRNMVGAMLVAATSTKMAGGGGGEKKVAGCYLWAFRVQDIGLRAEGLRIRVLGFWFKVLGM